MVTNLVNLKEMCENAFKCLTCNTSFERSFELKNHVKSVHEIHDKKFKCNISGFNFGTLETYVESIHKYNSKSFKCNKCFACFGNNSEFKKAYDTCSSTYKGNQSSQSQRKV